MSLSEHDGLLGGATKSLQQGSYEPSARPSVSVKVCVGLGVASWPVILRAWQSRTDTVFLDIVRLTS